jgi:hypothetical protein
MSGVTGGGRRRTTARIEAPGQPRKGPETATPRTYGTAPFLDPSARSSSIDEGRGSSTSTSTPDEDEDEGRQTGSGS